MVLIAHLSDIHLSPLPKVQWNELLSKRITGFLNWKLKRAKHMQTDILLHLVEHLKNKNPDLTAITGDIVNLSLDEEFKQAAIWLENFAPPEKLALIPGNHDAYLKDSFANFQAAFKNYTTGEMIEKQPYPFIRRVKNVAIISCSSAVPTLPFMAYGKFEQAQASRLSKALKALKQANYFRIVLIHHPVIGKAADGFRKGLHGAELFQQIIQKNGAELILHGHTHKSSVNAITGVSNGGLNGETPVIGVASASADAAHGDDPARYNLFNISSKGKEWRCEMSEFGYQRVGDDITERLKMRIY
jgi:3',5'-cyclic AMP phosphodiesterase CpdA